MITYLLCESYAIGFAYGAGFMSGVFVTWIVCNAINDIFR